MHTVAILVILEMALNVGVKKACEIFFLFFINLKKNLKISLALSLRACDWPKLSICAEQSRDKMM